jgi:exodeoxyribonuclease V beta subunit
VLKAQQEPSAAALNQQLNDLTQLADAGVTEVTSLITPSVMVLSKTRQSDEFQLQTLETQIDRQWRITSYSAIARNQFEIEHEKLEFDEVPIAERMQETVSLQLNESGEIALTRFTFPRGAQPGSFLHGVLENLDFTQPQASGTVIEQQGRWFGIEELWYPCVQSWIHDVLTTPIPLPEAQIQHDFILSSLSKQQICVEMEFHLPLNKVDVTEFNQLINSIFPTTQRHYDFSQLHGMLKGFIDLTFCINGQFFVADYKSNHLGDDYADYNDQKMAMAMRDHDYNLQSLLYVLALHRFLKVRIDNYDYDTHIGGAYYWFLRGMSAEHKGNGVMLFTPQKSTIEKLDVLFSGQQLPVTDPQSQPTEQLGLW